MPSEISLKGEKTLSRYKRRLKVCRGKKSQVLERLIKIEPCLKETQHKFTKFTVSVLLENKMAVFSDEYHFCTAHWRLVDSSVAKYSNAVSTASISSS